MHQHEQVIIPLGIVREIKAAIITIIKGLESKFTLQSFSLHIHSPWQWMWREKELSTNATLKLITYDGCQYYISKM